MLLPFSVQLRGNVHLLIVHFYTIEMHLWTANCTVHSILGYSSDCSLAADSLKHITWSLISVELVLHCSVISDCFVVAFLHHIYWRKEIKNEDSQFLLKSILLSASQILLLVLFLYNVLMRIFKTLSLLLSVFFSLLHSDAHIHLEHI